MAEFEMIAWLRGQLAAHHAPNKALPVPPGDDCAVIPTTGATQLFAADMLMDGVHFDLRTTRAQHAGRKALAVNISDIAAMAGTPTSITVCLALPRQGGMALAKDVMTGIMELAAEYGVAVAGGDTNSWDGPLVISIAILGTPHPLGSVTRAGAKVGDQICVTGGLGGSIAGKHLLFAPRVREAQILKERYGLTAMIDLSDGLGSDLRHILDASGVGAVLNREKIPVAPGAGGVPAALADGEDFELCFTLPTDAWVSLVKERPFGEQLAVTCVGEIVATKGLVWADGSDVVETGYKHAMD